MRHRERYSKGVLDKGVSEAAMEEVSQEEDLERKCLAA